jgi:hypothetical protein
VVGLADEVGRLIWQYAYTPFGELRHSEPMTTSPPDALTAAATNRIGHHGLRFERYDTPWAGAMQDASAYPLPATTSTIPPDVYTPVHGHYHNRNRMYSPALGRFMSRDPNALGTPVLSDLSFGGMALDASDVSADITGHYGDGINTHAAYAANPLVRTDSLGLWYDDFVEGVDVALNGLATASAVTDIHGLVQGMAEELIEQYSANISGDVDWALDWSQSDNTHSRMSSRWVNQALARGAAQHYNLDYWSEWADDVSSGPAVATNFRNIVNGVRKVGNAKKVIGRLLNRFNPRTFHFGGHSFTLDKAGMKHILEHNASTFGGIPSKKTKHTFFDDMSVDDIARSVQDVMSQNRDVLRRIGRSRGQVQGVVNGKRYIVGVNYGRVGQFYPVGD